MSSRGESRVSGRRRRRTPEAAEREIVDAAEALLREKPFRELTVDDLMRRTGLSRPSFYVYFRDRHDLVLKVVEHIGGELFAMSERWYEGTGDGPVLVREAIDGVVGVFAAHGPVLRALADAADFAGAFRFRKDLSTESVVGTAALAGGSAALHAWLQSELG